MRLALIQDIDVLIAIGGKLHSDTGFNPGVLEELAEARWHGVPSFIIGAFGGATGRLEHQVIAELSGHNLLGTEPGVTVDLATWTDRMDEYVGKLIAHLARHRQQFSRRKSKIQFSHGLFQFVMDDALTKKHLNISGVMNVDTTLVDKCSAQFADLKKAIEGKDGTRVIELLRNPPRLENREEPKRVAET